MDTMDDCYYVLTLISTISKETILLLLSKYDKLYYLLTTFNVVMMCYIRPNYDVTQPKLMSNN